MKKIAVAVIISVITLADLCGQEKSVEYEGQVSAYISYPSPGFGDWLNPGCGLMTVHGVRFNRADLLFTVGLQPKYYFVDRPRTEFFLLCEGGYIINGYGSDAGYVLPGIGVGFKLRNSHRVDLSVDVRTVLGDIASVGSHVSVYPHLALGYRF